MEEDKNPIGRPVKYDSEVHPKKVVGYCLLGLTDEQMAGLFEIAVSTFYQWKLNYADFSEAIKRGKEEADIKVAHSLYRKAIGYKEKKTVAFKLRETTNGEGSKERVELVDIEEYFPPEVAAQIFWLKNRNPQMWRDKKEIEVNDTSEITGVTLIDDDDEGTD